MERNNILADFAQFMISGITQNICIGLFGGREGKRLYREWKETDPFKWYLSLKIDQSDMLYTYLLRKSGELYQKRKEKREMNKSQIIT